MKNPDKAKKNWMAVKEKKKKTRRKKINFITRQNYGNASSGKIEV